MGAFQHDPFMKRRGLLFSLAALPATGPLRPTHADEATTGREVDDPYAGVEWSQCEYLHSMSHQHQGQTDSSRDVFYEMGYRHFAFSNYYPSAPTYPLPEDYVTKHPDLIGAPNAEQHSFPDAGLHFNSLGSLLATGYGSSLSGTQREAAPVVHRFEGLRAFDTARPWEGVYRLDVGLAAAESADASTAKLTITGATECAFRDNFADRGPVIDRPLAAGSHTIYLRATAPNLETTLNYDKARLSVGQFRLMQGANRSWRDVFRAALDGETVEGRRSGGLLHAEGGGITLNHPTGKREDYETFLDFDPRVLGIEIWNQLTSGFGSNKGFYDHGQGPHLHFYRLWDDILRGGRRCWGFFVKDHNTYGRGRNVLLLPGAGGGSTVEREVAALRAYRTGAFFGSVAALAANDAGEVIAPYDRSEFRFSRIAVRRDGRGEPVAIEAAVTGNDPEKRPNVQLRFVTDQGVELVADAVQAAFPLQRDAGGRLIPIFVRVEAFAYPGTHLRGDPLTAGMMRELNVYDISLLHDHKAARAAAAPASGPELRTPIPVVDMIFSQPLRRV